MRGRPNSRTIAISANTAWFIANFCRPLINGLRTGGFNPVVIAPVDPDLRHDVATLHFDHVELAIDRSGTNPLTDLRLIAEYRRLFRQLQPAAYLGFTIKPNIYGSIAAASLRIPAIPSVSGLGTAFLRGGLLQQVVTRLYRFAFRRAPTVFLQNEDDRRLFTNMRIVQHEQARVLPGLGIDLDHFRPEGPPPDGPVFLFIGRLLKDKGVRDFVEAARLLRAEMPRPRFQLLGPVDEGNRTAIGRADLQSWVEQGLIEYLGTSDDVRPFITAATAVVLPSYREGMPQALLEGAAMGRPLIATDVPGCRDIVEDGVNGYLCAVREPESLASAMRCLVALPAGERAAMGEAGRRQVQERFSQEFVVRAYLDVLTRVTAQPEN